jgi:DNA-binding NarL/FixJ family response regulator
MSDSLVLTCSVVIALRRQLDVDLLEKQISRLPPLNVVQATTDPLLARRYCEEHPVSLLIVDAGYPKNHSFEIAEEVVSNKSVRQVLILDDAHYTFRSKAAAKLTVAYASRNFPLEHLSERILRLAMDGRLRPSRMNGLIEQGSHRRVDSPNGERLSRREVEVLMLLAEGCSVRQCAEILHLSSSTVDNHKSHLMKKLEVHKATEIVRFAIRTGLVDA